MVPRDHFDIYNDTDTPIPAGGLCQWAGGVTSKGAVKVVMPTADSAPNLIVAGAHGVPARADGLGTFAPSVVVAFDPTGGTPAAEDTLGSQADSWLARKGNTGFVCYGGSNGPWALCVRPQGGVTPPAFDSDRLESAYDITADAVWEDVGISVDLPGPGRYVVWGSALALAAASDFGGGDEAVIEFRLVLTDAVLVAPTGFPHAEIARAPEEGQLAGGSGTLVFPIEISAATTIKMQAQRNVINTSGSPTWTASAIRHATPGSSQFATYIGYWKPGGGARGPAGEQGEPGDDGDDGADGATNPESENAVVGLQVFGP